MKVANSRFLLGALLFTAVTALGACELVASVDRDKIPGESILDAGGLNEAGDVSHQDVVSDKPVDTKPDTEASTANCTNKAKDGTETDIDCGGDCPSKCAVGSGCAIDGDCVPIESGKCTNKKCAAPGCSDTVKNGTETDIDCGGTCIGKCKTGGGCSVASDCESQVCTNKKCASGACDDKQKNGTETDVDCGGTCTTKCQDTKKCLADTDCMSGFCDDTNKVCNVAACNNVHKDSNETDVDCGGDCTTKCTVGKGCAAGNDCVDGVCDSTSKKCLAPSCTDTVKNGDETDTDCGGSCSPTSKCAPTKECKVNGDCQSDFCNQTVTPKVCEAAGCNDSALNGDETDTDCGGSCKKCTDNKACKLAKDCESANCAAGGDGGLQCLAPSCSDNIKNQGESDIDCGGTSPCARCADGKTCTAGTDCLTNHPCAPGTNTCVECLLSTDCALGKLCDTTAKTCSLNGCVAGQHECPSPETCCTGSCSDVTSDPLHCGGCATTCSNSHVPTPACTASVCTGACETGYGDCDGNKQTNGCEASVAGDVNNCGGCGTVCSSAHVTAACSGGVCNGACATDWTDCNSNKQTDGCEANDQTDVNNCGGCGKTCSATNIPTPSCTLGVCNGACATGFTDCNGNKLLDGCEANTALDATNCGGCGASFACSTQNITAACGAGVCNGTCTAGYTDCDSNKLSNGCEIHTAADANNCGGCGATFKCSTANITAACAAGVCNGTCASGFTDCDGDKLSNGCEINTAVDADHCGGCGPTFACSSANIASPSCSASICDGACTAPFLDCDLDKLTNGCEVDPVTDPLNCGACSFACGNSGTCAASVCVCGGTTCPAGKKCATTSTCES